MSAFAFTGIDTIAGLSQWSNDRTACGRWPIGLPAIADYPTMVPVPTFEPHAVPVAVPERGFVSPAPQRLHHDDVERIARRVVELQREANP